MKPKHRIGDWVRIKDKATRDSILSFRWPAGLHWDTQGYLRAVHRVALADAVDPFRVWWTVRYRLDGIREVDVVIEDADLVPVKD